MTFCSKYIDPGIFIPGSMNIFVQWNRSGLFNRELDFRYRISQIPFLTLDVDLTIRTDNSISISIDPLRQGGMSLRKIFKISFLAGTGNSDLDVAEDGLGKIS
jgi:hypothetical protein